VGGGGVFRVRWRIFWPMDIFASCFFFFLQICETDVNKYKHLKICCHLLTQNEHLVYFFNNHILNVKFISSIHEHIIRDHFSSGYEVLGVDFCVRLQLASLVSYINRRRPTWKNIR